jgi:putative oxidoreductase
VSGSLFQRGYNSAREVAVDIHLPFYLAGRLLFGGFFIMSGIRHFQYLDMMAGYTASKGFPLPRAAVMVSGLLIIVGGISILLGVRPHWGIALISLFLIPVTMVMHQYWKHTDATMRVNDQVNFMKNIALLGASWLMLLIPQPWPVSLTF